MSPRSAADVLDVHHVSDCQLAKQVLVTCAYCLQEGPRARYPEHIAIDHAGCGYVGPPSTPPLKLVSGFVTPNDWNPKLELGYQAYLRRSQSKHPRTRHGWYRDRHQQHNSHQRGLV